MPKFISLKQVDSDDIPEIGQGLSYFALLNQNHLSVPDGFILGTSIWKVLLKDLEPQLLAHASNFQQTTNRSDFFATLRSQTGKSFSLPTSLRGQILDQTKRFDYPLTIEVFAGSEKKPQINVFTTTIFSKGELLPTIKTAFLSTFNPTVLSEVSVETLETLQISLVLKQHPVAEVSGRLVVGTTKQGKARIYSQWGEYDPNATSDLAVVQFSNLAEESYNISLQEKQVTLKEDKFIKIPIAREFQFVRKLTEKQTQDLAVAAKRLSQQFFSSFTFKFSIFEGQILIVNLDLDQSPAQSESALSLIEYMPLYKKLTPLVTGIKTGPLHEIVNNKDLAKLRRGEIAALKYFDKKLLPSLKKASGIILNNTTGVTHEQVQAFQHLGKTSLSGSIENLRNKVVTIDGSTGKVYYGSFRPPYTKTLKPFNHVSTTPEHKHATAIFAKPKNLGEVKSILDLEVDGFLLDLGTNTEKLILQIGHQHHPIILQAQSENLDQVAKLIKTLRHKQGLTNLHLSLVVNSPAEFNEQKKLVASLGLHRGGSFKLLSTLITPGSALGFSDIAEQGVDGVIIDYHSLLNKTYGKEHTLEDLGSVEDSGVATLVTQIMNQAREHKLYTVITNLPAPKEKSLLNLVVSKGVKAIAVEPSQIAQAKQNLAKTEREYLSQTR